jgi:hypothetical protein
MPFLPREAERKEGNKVNAGTQAKNLEEQKKQASIARRFDRPAIRQLSEMRGSGFSAPRLPKLRLLSRQAGDPR